MAPENTAPAFDFAMAHNADVLEIDVRLSRDGQVIVIHDDALDRTTNGAGVVRNIGLGELKVLDAAYWFKNATEKTAPDGYPFRGRGVTLLTLGELFEQYPVVRVNIDIKDNEAAAVDAVAQVIAQYQAVDRSVVASFHDDVLTHCRERHPWLYTSAGMADVKRFYWWYLKGQKGPVPVSVKLFQLPMSYFCIPLAGKHFIQAVHSVNASINYWTINKPSQMMDLWQKGADGIVTDRADLADKILS